MINIKENNNIKTFPQKEENKEISTSPNTKPFFYENKSSDTSQSSPNKKVDRVLILEKIQELSPITLSNLTKKLPFSRSSIYYAIREFEFANLIETKMKLCKHGAEKWIYYLNKKGEGEK